MDDEYCERLGCKEDDIDESDNDGVLFEIVDEILDCNDDEDVEVDDNDDGDGIVDDRDDGDWEVDEGNVLFEPEILGLVLVDGKLIRWQWR